MATYQNSTMNRNDKKYSHKILLLHHSTLHETLPLSLGLREQNSKRDLLKPEFNEMLSNESNHLLLHTTQFKGRVLLTHTILGLSIISLTPISLYHAILLHFTGPIRGLLLLLQLVLLVLLLHIVRGCRSVLGRLLAFLPWRRRDSTVLWVLPGGQCVYVNAVVKPHHSRFTLAKNITEIPVVRNIHTKRPDRLPSQLGGGNLSGSQKAPKYFGK